MTHSKDVGANSPLYLYFGNLGERERQFKVPHFVGLALFPKHDREIRHDAMDPLPFDDNTAAKIQSQDVFEHLPQDKLHFVLDEVYRVLSPGGRFRLSLPDYRSPLLKKRSFYDYDGNLMGDIMMGAQPVYDKTRGEISVKFSPNGRAHLWFPVYEKLASIILASEIRKSEEIVFYQGFREDGTPMTRDIPDEEMFVIRSLPRDTRAGGLPISLVVDFVK